MKKSHRHNELSEKICSFHSCNKRLKKRLVESKESFDMCYKHHSHRESLRGHHIGIHGKPRKKRIEAGLPVKAY